MRIRLVVSVLALYVFGVFNVYADNTDVSFFVTSIGSGEGGNLGGLEGADAHCQTLAQQAGLGEKNFKAYLSTSAIGGAQAMNARDRIGNGPWHNANGILIANNLDELHSENNNLNKANSVNEKGEMINGRGDEPNLHDILTGSTKEGMSTASTCDNWTSSTQGKAMVGHHDKQGPPDRISWNSAHESFGCSLEDLTKTGGNGFFYCFAED